MIIKINTQTVNSAAKSRGFTPEEYIARLATISSGRKMCAHFKGVEAKGSVSIFLVSKCAHI